jgi:hypothetical protein
MITSGNKENGPGISDSTIPVALPDIGGFRTPPVVLLKT